MKTLALFLTGLILLCVFFQIKGEIFADYQWEQHYSQFWHLADKSSTIPAKQELISKFADALQNGYSRGELASHDAIFLKTPNNSFEANLTALRSLSDRLKEIQGMNPSSFEYNTAIQQITAQEQGEASAMMGVFYGCFILANYPLIWGWIGAVTIGVEIVFAIFAIILWFNADY